MLIMQLSREHGNYQPVGINYLSVIMKLAKSGCLNEVEGYTKRVYLKQVLVQTIDQKSENKFVLISFKPTA